MRTHVHTMTDVNTFFKVGSQIFHAYVSIKIYYSKKSNPTVVLNGRPMRKYATEIWFIGI